MLSKGDIKFIKSLQVKKYRKHEQCFLAEGAKSVQELLASTFEVLLIAATGDFLATVTVPQHVRIEVVKPDVLASLGEFQSNNAAIAVARIKPETPIEIPDDVYALVLDDIRDPGNVGTIIRTADWYGIQYVVASAETADFYNAKVISATMGSFTRVQVWYTDLVDFLATQKQRPVYGAYLGGEDVHKISFGRGGLIIIGNESRGINPKLEPFVTRKITIPRFGSAESLNAAIATAVICDNIRSRG